MSETKHRKWSTIKSLDDLIIEKDAKIAELEKGAEKIAPVQGFSAGIPWAMHLRAYDAYCKRYGEQKALIDLEGRNCRGGFGVTELDAFIPGWREELSELKKLRERAEAAEAQVAELQGNLVNHGAAIDGLKGRTFAAEAKNKELEAALRELAHQVQISGAVDDHGHQLSMLKALQDAWAALSRKGESQ